MTFELYTAFRRKWNSSQAFNQAKYKRASGFYLLETNRTLTCNNVSSPTFFRGDVQIIEVMRIFAKGINTTVILALMHNKQTLCFFKMY